MAKNDPLLEAFLTSLDDERVSRGEKKAMRALLMDDGAGPERRASLRAALFDEICRRAPGDAKLLRGLETAISVLYPANPPGKQTVHPPTRAWFGPEDPMAETLCTLIEGVRTSLDVAVFTITDDRVTKALLKAHERNIRVRIISDDDKAGDRGSDVIRLGRAGVPVRTDHSPHHMHHKFAVFDSRSVLTGSYNWTRGAAFSNRENFLLTYEERAVARYAEAFETLWSELG
ncbi:MAG: hypothetical protein GY898_16935 [Proteobacteria bacterium]|nr:hypothetical protein [Pseudomonadota bacterium]